MHFGQRERARHGFALGADSQGNANQTVTNGRLLVYDLENFVKRADGSSKLNVLWDSQGQNYQFMYNKFNVGVVSGGKFVLPRYDGGMDVLGLA